MYFTKVRIYKVFFFFFCEVKTLARWAMQPPFSLPLSYSSKHCSTYYETKRYIYVRGNCLLRQLASDQNKHLVIFHFWHFSLMVWDLWECLTRLEEGTKWVRQPTPDRTQPTSEKILLLSLLLLRCLHLLLTTMYHIYFCLYYQATTRKPRRCASSKIGLTHPLNNRVDTRDAGTSKNGHNAPLKPIVARIVTM